MKQKVAFPGSWRFSRFSLMAAAVLSMTTATSLFATETNQNSAGPAPSPSNFAERLKMAYADARSRYQSDTNNVEAAWHFARAGFDLAEFSTNNTERAQLAEKGITVCRQLLIRNPKLPEAHYYLAMNLGQLADTKRNLAALKMVKEMEREFQSAADLKPHLDYAGPHRSLGLLYAQAPSIISIGSRSKSRQHLQRAVELEPDFPGNRLDLIEAYIKWNDRTEALRELKILEAGWAAAKKKFSGEEWAHAWMDWEKKLKAVKAKLPDSAKKP